MTTTQAEVLKEVGGDLNTQQQEKFMEEVEKMAAEAGMKTQN